MLTADTATRTVTMHRTLVGLCGVLQAICTAGWPLERIHLFGFAQGGTVALHLLARVPAPLGSCIAVCAAFLPEFIPAKCIGKTPVVLHSGRSDASVSTTDIATTENVLRKSKHSVDTVWFNKGCSMIGSEAEMRPCMELWSRALSRRPVDNSFEQVPDNVTPKNS
eukprot:c18169_g1_i3.p1 GENE.c18169_g1_i3~~c18169_g1_i3.p1  ORF type:complete len:166 (+),score=23.08 c18169_g1_i3:511-1008(+)